ncbi:Uncharacterised protein [Vibrio cholerae]|uniref:Uncharacterized protein n=1 Tax=Vibrio cholerae TaxID=666 RepID=A0A655QDT6_VIBCL|nr:Uncharacterised protein [Vibrio cholerae]CSB38315.1 Uncharacterised protein [Vibrio cholerae]CSB44977.1 Uncharacterised protein [Vibrio cholerae]CSC03345.1 Uncharacterised protein [Vibrio cholerae]
MAKGIKPSEVSNCAAHAQKASGYASSGVNVLEESKV